VRLARELAGPPSQYVYRTLENTWSGDGSIAP
jgi:hypothetical protein